MRVKWNPEPAIASVGIGPIFFLGWSEVCRFSSVSALLLHRSVIALVIKFILEEKKRISISRLRCFCLRQILSPRPSWLGYAPQRSTVACVWVYPRQVLLASLLASLLAGSTADPLSMTLEQEVIVAASAFLLVEDFNFHFNFHVLLSFHCLTITDSYRVRERWRDRIQEDELRRSRDIQTQQPASAGAGRQRCLSVCGLVSCPASSDGTGGRNAWLPRLRRMDDFLATVLYIGR